MELAIYFKKQIANGTLCSQQIIFEGKRIEVAFGMPGKDMSKFHPRNNSTNPQWFDVRIDEIRNTDFSTKDGMLNFKLSTWDAGSPGSAAGDTVEFSGDPAGFFHEKSLKDALNDQRHFFSWLFFQGANTTTFDLFESTLSEFELSLTVTPNRS